MTYVAPVTIATLPASGALDAGLWVSTAALFILSQEEYQTLQVARQSKYVSIEANSIFLVLISLLYIQ